MSCSGASIPIRTMPETSDCITSAPSTAPATVPTPPLNDVPPITAAAITFSSMPVPRLLTAAFRRAICTAAASPTRKPINANVLTIVRFVLMPASTAASGLPPMP